MCRCRCVYVSVCVFVSSKALYSFRYAFIAWLWLCVVCSAFRLAAGSGEYPFLSMLSSVSLLAMQNILNAACRGSSSLFSFRFLYIKCLIYALCNINLCIIHIVYYYIFYIFWYLHSFQTVLCLLINYAALFKSQTKHNQCV